MLQRPVTGSSMRPVAGTPWSSLIAWIDYTDNPNTPRGLNAVNGEVNIGGTTSGYAVAFRDVGAGWIPSSTMWHRFTPPYGAGGFGVGHTYVVVATIPTVPTGVSYLAFQGDGGSGQDYDLLYATNTAVAVQARHGGGAAGGTNFGFIQVAHTPMRDGRAHVLAATTVNDDVGNQIRSRLYFDGLRVGSNTVASSVSNGNNTRLSVGIVDDSSPSASNGNVVVHAVAVFARELDDAEVAAVSADPWWPWRAEFDAAFTSTPPPSIPDGTGVPVTQNTTASFEFGLGSGPVESVAAWENDLSEYVYELSIVRGRSGLLQRFETGTATIRLNNDDGRFDPGNEDSPYWPNLRLRTPIRIRLEYDGTVYTVFRGLVEEWPIAYGETASTSWVDLPLVDMTDLLARRKFVEQSFAAGRTDERIDAILDAVGWDAGLRDLDEGIGNVPAETWTGSALDLIYRAVDAEAGFFFVAADGTATFRKRTALAGGASSSATFADDGTGLVYSSPQFAYNDETLFTQATATRDDGMPQVAEDAAAVALYDRINLDVSGSFENDNAALNVAEWMVLRHKDVQRRVTSIVVEPQYDEANLWPQVLVRELRDGVTVKFTPPGGGTAVDQLCAIERIEHRMSRSGPWETTYGLHPLADIEQESFFTLDSSLLDGDDVLA